MFGIPAHELEAGAGLSLAGNVPIMLGPVIVSCPKVHNEVINQIINVAILLQGFVLVVLGEAWIGKIKQGVPSVVVTGQLLVAEGRKFGDVILAFIPAKITGDKIFIIPFV